MVVVFAVVFVVVGLVGGGGVVVVIIFGHWNLTFKFVQNWVNNKGACKYYISTLGVGGGSEGNAYFAYLVRGDGGSRGKMLILLM